MIKLVYEELRLGLEFSPCVERDVLEVEFENKN